MTNPPTFGAIVRERRLELAFGLRRFAERIGMSATYLSKVERGEFPPPAEEKVVAIATALGLDQDELLAAANRVATDVTALIKKRPEMAEFLRTANRYTADELNTMFRAHEGAGDVQEEGP